MNPTEDGTSKLTDAELLAVLEDAAISRSATPTGDVLWAAVRALRPPLLYRIALRPNEHGMLDDVVVNDVSMFRMEDMGDYWWICCYLAGTDERICWRASSTARFSHVEITTTESPDENEFVYEHNLVRLTNDDTEVSQ